MYYIHRSVGKILLCRLYCKVPLQSLSTNIIHSKGLRLDYHHGKVGNCQGTHVCSNLQEARYFKKIHGLCADIEHAGMAAMT